MSETPYERYTRTLNRVTKWRSILTGRVAGTRAKGDPVGDGYRDLFEKLIILRCEVSAITTLLMSKGLVTQVELLEAVADEADALDAMYEKVFPGMKSTDEGISLSLPGAIETVKDWPR